MRSSLLSVTLAVALTGTTFAFPSNAATPGHRSLSWPQHTLHTWLRTVFELPLFPSEVTQPNLIPAHWFGPGPLHKVWIDGDDSEFLAQADALDALVRLEDYGAFQLAVVDEVAFGGAEVLRATGAHFRDELDLMVFNGLRINGQHPGELLERLDPSERFASEASTALEPNAGLYIVQFDGPVKDAWLENLDEVGVLFKQPVPMNAYVVQLRGSSVYLLEALAEKPESHIQFTSVYEPGFRIQSPLRMAQLLGHNEPMSVTIQVVNTDGVRRAMEEIASLADQVLNAHEVGPYVNVEALVHPVHFQTIAANNRVFQIEELGERRRTDEVQAQLVSGNISGSGPSGPNYLSWLASVGFGSGQFTSFSVNVVDDAYSLTGHPDLSSSRVAFQNNPTSQGGSQGGHGFLNAHIVAGFNNSTSSAANDSNGYNYGLGIAPWAQVGCTAIFGFGSATSTSWEQTAYNSGARISTNSWGYQSGGGPVPFYNSAAQEYDYITRDATSSGGNQELLVVFAASNDGSGSNTVSSPGTAKNIITVAAGENVRQTGTDGCGIGNSGASSVNDIIGFSSRGPVNSSGGDGRWKPEISAPGTHIQAGVPQSNYSGSSVCNGYWPSGQTLYGWSSGTSHSCPAVAGGAALVYQWFLNNGLSAPSPAMMKAVLTATPNYMTGIGAGGSLPSNSQGMGNMNVGRAFDGSDWIREDQGVVLSSSGQSHVVSGDVANTSLPLRVALVWTDAPGPTSGAPYINDLNLTVSIGGNTYRGNVFSGANSATGGSADIRNNAEFVYLPAGTTGAFTITVTAASIGGDGVTGNGDSTDQDFALAVYNGTDGPVVPTANFFATPTTGNAPLTVNFTDTSSGSPTSWSWSFGDGGTSTAQNPSHTYTSPGSYSVSLTMNAPGGGDSETKTDYITANIPPPPGVSDGSFESQSAGSAPTSPWSTVGGSHVVNPSGGTTSDGGMPTHGTNWAELSAADTNGGTPPSNPGGATTPSSGGAGVTQSFSYGTGATELSFDAAFLRNETANSSYNDWMSVELSDGSTTQSLYYADTGTATVGTSSKHGFAMTAVTNVNVDLATLFPSSTTSTTFTLTAVVANGTDGIQPSIGYIDNFEMIASVPAPVAEFSGTPTSGVEPLSVNFTDGTTGSVSSWSWSFGDGGTSTAQNPSHTYSSAGTYTVTLTATGPGGSDAETKAGYITVSDAPPTAGFSGTPTSGTYPLSVNFSDASSGNIASWSWAFGDGGTSTAQNPSHTYTAAGTYSVALTVTGPGGSDTSTQVDYITVTDPAPEAGFTGSPTSGVVPLSVNFTDSSSGPISSWSWNFGDGGSSTAQNPSHTYNSTGTYSVSLTVTGPGGSDTLTRTNYIAVSDPPPTADFSGSPTSGTAPLSVNFSDASSGNVTSWSWNFGDGGSSTAQNPSHTYSSGGSYTVSLTATGPGGSDTNTKVGYIVVDDPAPTASFSGSPTSGTAPLSVSFSDGSSGPITDWSWTFGDGGTSTAQNPSHTYSSAGTYSVSLTVTGPGGSDTATLTNYISVSEPPPVADFSGSPTSGVVPLSVNFSDASTGAISSWSWTFGDGGTSTAQNPSHTYNSTGTYSVSLTVTGPGGSDTLTRTNYISVGNVPPTSSFSGTPTSGDAPLTVNFSDASSGPITSWAWTFGDGGTSTAQNPSHTYTAGGSYSVSLTVTGPGGSDTSTLSNYITVTEPAPTASFSGTPTSGDAPLFVAFSDASSGAITSWSWTFGDGGSSTAQNPNHTYNSSGSYSVSLTVTGPGGSDTSTLTNYVTVTDAAPVAGFTGTPTSGTAPLNVSFSDASSGSVSSWSWTFGDGGTSTAQNPSHTYSSAGTYTVSLTATGPGGSDTATLTDYITVTDPPSGNVVYMTFLTNTVVPGVGTVRDEDVVAYDTATGTWSLYFDGTDVGIGAADIDAIHVRPTGEIVMSFQQSTITVPGLIGGPGGGEAVDDSDLVVFFPISTGPNTSGVFQFLFDGSDVGLTTNGEDIDGVWENTNGDLCISTRGSASHNFTSRDEDVIYFDATTLGEATSGLFTVYVFDGSDVGFNASGGHDLDGVSIGGPTTMYYSTVGSWTAGSTGSDEDIGLFTGSLLGGNTSGSTALFLDLSAFGIDPSEDVDGFTVQ